MDCCFFGLCVYKAVHLILICFIRVGQRYACRLGSQDPHISRGFIKTEAFLDFFVIGEFNFWRGEKNLQSKNMAAMSKKCFSPGEHSQQLMEKKKELIILINSAC